jgi:TatD DNase family protein
MLIDSHCHIPHEKYEKNTEEILNECKEWGVEKLINIGTSKEENNKVVDIANKYSSIFCSVGIYPHENKKIAVSDLKSSLEESLGKSNKIVAIGECGIDISGWENGRLLKDQIELFEMQVLLSKENNLPIIVHNRNGDDYVYDILKRNSDPGLTGVIHCFDSDWDYAKKILDLGFYISFTNLITYPKKEALLEVVKNVPEGRFLVETDAPYLPPQTMRGKINYPKYVKIVAEKVAQVKQKTFEEVSELSYKNTCSLFNI